MKYVSYENSKLLVSKVLELLETKLDKDSITDLEIIRNGANLGVTALQKHQDISTKADKSTTLEGYGITDAYTKEEIDSMVSSVFHYVGSIDTVEDLPDDASVGDVYEVKSENANYSWNGEEWLVLGAMIDISGKADVSDTLAGYGIKDAYTKNDLATVLYDNLPLIDDGRSYILRGNKTFDSYKEVATTFYQLQKLEESYCPLSSLGGSGLYVINNTEDNLVLTVTLQNREGFDTGTWVYGYANDTASPSAIFYNLNGSDKVELGTAVLRGSPLTVPIVIPPSKKGYIYANSWTSSEPPTEVVSAVFNQVFNVRDNFQPMKVRTDALSLNPVVLTQEEYDAIEPKNPDTMYYILEN